MDTYLLLFLVALVTFVGSYIQGATGFGFGIFAMIFLPKLLQYTEANVLSSMLSACGAKTAARPITIPGDTGWPCKLIFKRSFPLRTISCVQPFLPRYPAAWYGSARRTNAW